MHEANVYRVSAFTSDSEGGNEAGVLFLHEWPNEAVMQEIAKKVGYSETAFVVMKNGKLNVRYFTPVKEVAMCGHASLALLGVAYEEGLIEAGVHRLYANDTTLEAVVDKSEIKLHFKRPKSLKTFKRFEPLDHIDLKSEDLSEVPVAIMDAGVRELYIGMNTLEKLKTYQPNMDAIKTLSVAFNVAGIYIYHLNVLEKTVHARNFLPAIGIEEESATGTATAALMAHFHDTFETPPDALRFHQGEWMGKPSRLDASYSIFEGALEGIYVSGTTKLKDSITVTINHN